MANLQHESPTRQGNLGQGYHAALRWLREDETCMLYLYLYQGAGRGSKARLGYEMPWLYIRAHWQDSRSGKTYNRRGADPAAAQVNKTIKALIKAGSQYLHSCFTQNVEVSERHLKKLLKDAAKPPRVRLSTRKAAPRPSVTKLPELPAATGRGYSSKVRLPVAAATGTFEGYTPKLRIMLYRRPSRDEKLCYLYAYLNLEGRRSAKGVSTGYKVDPAEWDSHEQKHTGALAEELKNYLFLLHRGAERIINERKIGGLATTVEELKTALFQLPEDIGREKGKKFWMSAVMMQYANLTLDTQKEATRIQYRRFQRIVLAFLEDRFPKLKGRFSVTDVTPGLARSLETYLLSDLGLMQSTAARLMKWVKCMIGYAYNEGLIKKNALYSYRCVSPATEHVYLTAAEVEQLSAFKPQSATLEKVQDGFLFCCYTGCAWSDFEALTVSNISTDFAGTTWLTYQRKKTGQKALIPLLPQAIALVAKHGGRPLDASLIPCFSGQKSNLYIKEIAGLAGIAEGEKLHWHIARKTCATLFLEAGMSMDAVAKILGHASTKITQAIYSRVTVEKLGREIQVVARNLPSSRDTPPTLARACRPCTPNGGLFQTSL